MDQITKLYKNKAEMLAEQVAFLEKQLKNIQEAQAPAMDFSPEESGIFPNLLVPGIVAASIYGAGQGIQQIQRVRQTNKPVKVKLAGVKVPPPESAQAKIKIPKGIQQGVYGASDVDIALEYPAADWKGKPGEIIPGKVPTKAGTLGTRFGLKEPEGLAPKGTAEVKPSTIGGKPVVKGKPSVAERAAIGRDRLRARMDVKAAEAAQTLKPAQISVKPSIAQKTTNLAKGFGKGLAGFGVGMGGYFLGKEASDIALGAAGIENETAKEIAGEAVGGAAGGVAATGVGSLMTGAGLPTAAAIGGAALKGGLVGLAAYGGLKAGQAIGQAVGDIEIDEKGTQVSDVAGKTIYDIYGRMTGKGTSSEQLNTAKTGVVGGDKQKMAQNIADEAEEEFQKKDEMEKRKAAIRARRAMQK